LTNLSKLFLENFTIDIISDSSEMNNHTLLDVKTILAGLLLILVSLASLLPFGGGLAGVLFLAYVVLREKKKIIRKHEKSNKNNNVPDLSLSSRLACRAAFSARFSSKY
jgi:hypothetical protein